MNSIRQYVQQLMYTNTVQLWLDRLVLARLFYSTRSTCMKIGKETNQINQYSIFYWCNMNGFQWMHLTPSSIRYEDGLDRRAPSTSNFLSICYSYFSCFCPFRAVRMMYMHLYTLRLFNNSNGVKYFTNICHKLHIRVLYCSFLHTGNNGHFIVVS